MALSRSTVDVTPPFGPAVVKRGLAITFTVQTRSATTGLWAAKDISGSRWTYTLRVWSSDDDTDPISALTSTVTKGSAASSGELDHYHSCGATVYATLKWEIVEIDNDNTDASTRSGKRERVLTRWFQPIEDAP